MDKMKGVTLTPAYGKDYTSRNKIIEAMNAGKDFVANHYTGSSGYCSIRDCADGQINVRYAKLAKVAVINIKNGIAF